MLPQSASPKLPDAPNIRLEQATKAKAKAKATASAKWWEASEKGMCPTLETLLRHGQDPEACNDDGATALIVAAAHNRVSAVQLLLNAKANTAASDELGVSALRSAALEGHTAVVRMLIDAGAALDAPDSSGHTALHHAVWNSRLPSVKLLVKANASLDARNKAPAACLLPPLPHAPPPSSPSIMPSHPQAGIRVDLRALASAKRARGGEVHGGGEGCGDGGD